MPEDREVAEHLSVDLPTLWRWKAELEGVVHLSLQAPAAPSDRATPDLGDQLAGESGTGIEDRLNLQQETAFLKMRSCASRSRSAWCSRSITSRS